MGEDVVPEVAPQIFHAGASAHYLIDEIEGPAHLEEEGEKADGFLWRDTRVAHFRQHLIGEIDPAGCVTVVDLFLDMLIETGAGLVVDQKKDPVDGVFVCKGFDSVFEEYSVIPGPNRYCQTVAGTVL